MRRVLWTFALSILASSAAFAQSYTVTDLVTLGGAHTEANGIGSLGQIAGTAEGADGIYHAFLYSGRSMHDFGTFDGAQNTATAINESGQIVGQAYTAGNRNAHAFLYCGGQMFDLETLGNTYSAALAINAAGTEIVGWSGDHAFLYTNGRMQDLDKLIPRNSGWT